MHKQANQFIPVHLDFRLNLDFFHDKHFDVLHSSKLPFSTRAVPLSHKWNAAIVNVSTDDTVRWNIEDKVMCI